MEAAFTQFRHGMDAQLDQLVADITTHYDTMKQENEEFHRRLDLPRLREDSVGSQRGASFGDAGAKLRLCAVRPDINGGDLATQMFEPAEAVVATPDASDVAASDFDLARARAKSHVRQNSAQASDYADDRVNIPSVQRRGDASHVRHSVASAVPSAAVARRGPPDTEWKSRGDQPVKLVLGDAERSSIGRLSKAEIQQIQADRVRSMQTVENMFKFKDKGTAEDRDWIEKMRALRQSSAHNLGVVEIEETINRKTNLRDWMRSVVKSNSFETLCTTIIVANAVTIGIETDWRAKNPKGSSVNFVVTEYCFFGFFALELAIRFFAAGMREFFCGKDRIWYGIDALTVGSSFGELTMTLIGMADDTSSTNSGVEVVANVRLARVIRIMRVLRVLRIARMFRFSTALRALVSSIIGTLRSLFWAMVLLIIIVYTFGIILTQAASLEIESRDLTVYNSPQSNCTLGQVLDGLVHYWGALGPSMLTLFMSIVNGISWEHAKRPLESTGWVWCTLFYAYIIFAYLAVLNVITANFCQTAIESAKGDEDLIVHGILMERQAYTSMLRKLFDKIDGNMTGRISLKEMQMHFRDEAVQAYFTSLDLEPHDAWELFKMLDEDSGDNIDDLEFIAGCLRLRGPAKTLDVVRLIGDVALLSNKMGQFMAFVEEELFQIKIGTCTLDDAKRSAAKMLTPSHVELTAAQDLQVHHGRGPGYRSSAGSIASSIPESVALTELERGSICT